MLYTPPLLVQSPLTLRSALCVPISTLLARAVGPNSQVRRVERVGRVLTGFCRARVLVAPVARGPGREYLAARLS